MSKHHFKIKVPGSTSNIGPGFDSIGIAINLYLTIECTPHDEWVFIQKDKAYSHLPTGKDNMIYQAAIYVAEKYNFSSLPPHKIEVATDIPIARGLGSSGSVTVAGVELANQILQLNLSVKDKVLLASEMEGHPDNVAPSIIGGCVVSYFNHEDIYFVEKKQMDVDFVTMIPNFELRTKMARDALPVELPYFQSIEGSAIGNVCSAAIFQDNYPLLGEVMEKEVFHQSYRKKFIPHFDQLMEYMKQEGAYGTFLSGAGPTMISICESGKAKQKLDKWNGNFPDSDWRVLRVEDQGLQVEVQEPVVFKAGK